MLGGALERTPWPAVRIIRNVRKNTPRRGYSHCTGHGAQAEVSLGKGYEEVSGVGKGWVRRGM